MRRPVRAFIGWSLVALASAGLVACGDDEGVAGDEDNPNTFVADRPLGSMDDAKFGTVTLTLEGRPLYCVVYKDNAGAHTKYSGLSCNWEEWNDGNPPANGG